jgi:hypothetical protein
MVAATVPERDAVREPAAATPGAAPVPEVDEVQREAERSLLRDALVGIVVGILVGAGVWSLLVLVALAGTDWDLGPAMWMGAGVGVFAGSFYGGWAGTVVGCRKLEEAEARSAHRAHA